MLNDYESDSDEKILDDYDPDLENFEIPLGQNPIYYSKSLIDPNIDIDEENFAVSYLKKRHIVDSANIAEHGFLLIQANDTLFRIDLVFKFNRAVNREVTKIRIKEEYYTTYLSLYSMYVKLIWKGRLLENSIDLLCGKTWKISKCKCDDLLDDIGRDKINPPEYSVLGKRGTANLFTALSYSRIIPTWIGSSSFIAILSTPLSSTTTVIGLGLITAVIAPVMRYIDIKSESMDGKFHNCGIWIVEKLRRLDIDEINADLKDTLFDNLIYVPSQHLGDEVEQEIGYKKFKQAMKDKVSIAASKHLNPCNEKIVNLKDRASESYVEKFTRSSASHVAQLDL